MDKFEQYIKDSLENYEVPYSEESWLAIKDRIPSKKPMSILKYSISLIMIGFLVLFNPSTISEESTPQLFQETKQFVITEEVEEIPKIVKKEMEEVTEITDSINLIEDMILVEGIIPKDIVLSTDTLTTFTLTTTLAIDTNVSILPIAIIEPSTDYFIPSAFTPNGDGLNDKFTIISESISEINFELLIYDRWGELVFETINPKYEWDGGECHKGLYIWILKIQDDDGIIHFDKGTVTIIK